MKKDIAIKGAISFVPTKLKMNVPRNVIFFFLLKNKKKSQP